LTDTSETARLAKLFDYQILDTAPEREFDDIAAAARLFNAPMSAVSLIDRDRQWFKARYGIGASETPHVGGGRVPLTLHLLSPAHRPVQVTRDLAGFWAGSYVAVRKDLRGRYPRHSWPEDPLQAEPTRRAKPR